MFKRGQQPAASGAAILILLITVVLIMYILFLPPQDRAELLGDENETDDDDDETRSGFNKTLLKEKVGRLDHLKFDEREHEMPSFRIYSETSGTVLKSSSSIYVSRSLGSKKELNLTFGMSKRLTSNVKLSFNVKNSRGRLEIRLNGVEIFNGILSVGTPLPIELSKDLLDSKNVLTFRVSSPGVAFWRTNEYLLENVVITGDVLDVSHSTGRQFFFVTEEEQLNLESVKLKFHPGCDLRTVGPLIIYLNGDEVFSGVADCGIFNILFMDKNSILVDKNELEFVATEGSYLIDRLSVKTELEELLFPVYFFDVDEDLFDDPDSDNPEFDDDFNVTLSIRFVNDDFKRLEYIINGHRRGINTDEFIFEELIDRFLLPETNSLEIIPKSSPIDIAELKVTLDEND